MKPIRLAASTPSMSEQDRAVLMEMQAGLMYAADPIHRRVLELLEQGSSHENVLEIISRQGDFPGGTKDSDLEVYIERLYSYGITAKAIIP